MEETCGMKNLHELRKRSGLTQSQLSTRTGISRARLVYAEGGYQLTPEEEANILAVIEGVVEDNSASIRRAMADRAATLATA